MCGDQNNLPNDDDDALVDLGADVNAMEHELGRTPLAWALENGHLEVAEFLRQHGAEEYRRE